VLAQSRDRRKKEWGMRRRQLKWLWKRLQEIPAMKFSKKTDWAMKLGAAKQRAPSAWRLVGMEIGQSEAEPSFQFRLRKKKLREVRRREGRYWLRSNLREEQPGQWWRLYIQLRQVEEAFKNLKGDLSLRPLFHQKEARIEAHIFVAFSAYCLHVTLRRWLRDLASGLTPRSVLEKFSGVQMIGVHLPTNRRQRSDSEPIHSTGEGSATVAEPIETAIAGTAAPENHGGWGAGQLSGCSEDLWGRSLDFQALAHCDPLESAKSG
jgi:hypothetical protein